MMKPSEFQTTIENQFDYICKVAMEDERKDYLKALSRQCKRETLFCDMDDYTVNLFSSEDTYPSHFHTFEMDGFTVRIENSLLGGIYVTAVKQHYHFHLSDWKSNRGINRIILSAFTR